MPGKERPRKKGGLHNPLADDLERDRVLAGDGISRVVREEQQLHASEMNQRVMKVARMASNKADADDDEEGDGVPLNEDAFDYNQQDGHYDGAEDDDENFENESEVSLEYDKESNASEMVDFPNMEEVYEIDDEEGALLERFQPQTGVQTRNLADIIMSKINDKKNKEGGEDGTASQNGGDGSGKPVIDRRVAKIYMAIGPVLKNYTSGKIPKAFKVLPHVQNWEQLIMLTRPHEWSPHATYNAARIFASALNERMAQRFYSAILLPLIHTEIEKNKKLHPSHYMAVRKALFKPVAFYKGFLLPLLTEEEFECTLKEALIIGSVLQKNHLPPIPTAVVIVKLCEVPFSSAQCVILRVLIDKKMALPYQCVDALILYFHRFCNSHPSSEALPVLWHQTFLLFVTYYKNDFNEAQLNLLKAVCSTHFHHHITPEVRREISFAQGKKHQY